MDETTMLALENIYGAAALLLLFSIGYIVYLMCTVDVRKLNWNGIITGFDYDEYDDDIASAVEVRAKYAIWSIGASLVIMLFIPISTLEHSQTYSSFIWLYGFLWLTFIVLLIFNTTTIIGAQKKHDQAKRELRGMYYGGSNRTDAQIEADILRYKNWHEKAFPQNALKKFPIVDTNDWESSLIGLNYLILSVLIFFIIIL